MAYKIHEIAPKDLKQFIKFPFELYKGNPYYVPPIIDFEISTLSPKKNPAFKQAAAKYWLVKDGKKSVGRVAAILLNNEFEDKKLVRFGWIDFIDDFKVSSLLIQTVEHFAKEHGAIGVHGPLGFTDLDFEGTLISGFDEMATQATIYNYPYYQTHFERSGYGKACDWFEMRGTVPEKVPDSIREIAQKVSDRYKIKSKKFKRTKEVLKYSKPVFDLLNETYRNLYGYYPLSNEQIDYFIKMYFGFIRLEYISLIVNENDDVVAFAITLPSLSKAFQKAKGHLYPIGFIHVLKSFYSNNHLDLFLIAVKPEYQRRGAFAIIFYELFSIFVNNGVKYLTTGPMMETNNSVLNSWKGMEEHLNTYKIQRRCFIKYFDVAK